MLKQKTTELVEDLLSCHYDPSYLRYTSSYYQNLSQAQHIQLTDLSNNTLKMAASTYFL